MKLRGIHRRNKGEIKDKEYGLKRKGSEGREHNLVTRKEPFLGIGGTIKKLTGKR